MGNCQANLLTRHSSNSLWNDRVHAAHQIGRDDFTSCPGCDLFYRCTGMDDADAADQDASRTEPFPWS